MTQGTIEEQAREIGGGGVGDPHGGRRAGRAAVSSPMRGA
jgi:hypothetical protein